MTKKLFAIWSAHPDLGGATEEDIDTAAIFALGKSAEELINILRGDDLEYDAFSAILDTGNQVFIGEVSDIKTVDTRTVVDIKSI